MIPTWLVCCKLEFYRIKVWKLLRHKQENVQLHDAKFCSLQHPTHALSFFQKLRKTAQKVNNQPTSVRRDIPHLLWPHRDVLYHRACVSSGNQSPKWKYKLSITVTFQLQYSRNNIRLVQAVMNIPSVMNINVLGISLSRIRYTPESALLYGNIQLINLFSSWKLNIQVHENIWHIWHTGVGQSSCNRCKLHTRMTPKWDSSGSS